MTSPAGSSDFASSFGAAPTQVGTVSPDSPGSTVLIGGVPDEDRDNANMPVPGDGVPGTGLSALQGHELGASAQPEQSNTMLTALERLLDTGSTDATTTLSIQKALVSAGLLNPDDTTFTPGAIAEGDATYDAFASLLNTSIATGKGYNQILQERAKAGAGKKFIAEFNQRLATSAGKPITKTETTTNTQLTDAPDAEAIADNESQSLLGRRVTTKEASQFFGQLTAEEKANPSVTTAQVTYDPTLGDQPEVRNETTSGGINEAGESELADQNIIQNHGQEYAQAQGNQIYDLFASLIGGSQ